MDKAFPITHRAIPNERLAVPTRYGVTHVAVAGPQDAPPIVLLSAMGVTSRMWMPNLAELSQDYRVYALDTIGDLGESILYDSEHYPKNGQAYSEWLVDVFNELGIVRIDVIGASMGGWITMDHAIHAPERVRRIVLLGPMGLPSWWTTLKVMSHLWVAPPLNLSNDQLRNIKPSTLLMLGERDNVIGDVRAVGDRAKRHIPRVQVEVIPNAGHVMSTEKPDFVNARILSFLRMKGEP